MRAASCAVLAALAAGCGAAQGDAEELPRHAERLWARTADGWDLALVRYRPAGAPSGLPVLLCHGFSANERNLDLDASHSLARWLAARGREVFTVSLRGAGGSRPVPGGKAEPLGETTIDTLAERDLPAAIARVEEVAGAPQVDLVGHSMGGMVAYLYLARGGDQVHALVVLGAPARFAWGGRVEALLARGSPLIAALPGVLQVPALARAALPLLARLDTPLDVLMYNPNNVGAATWRALLAVGSAPVERGVLRQFARILERGGLVSADGAVDYRPLLSRARVPALVVAGKLDRIAPPPAVKAGYDLLGGEKAWFVAGEENGLRFDYGHMDLVVGDRAGEELWPRLLAFLAAHDPPARGAAGGAAQTPLAPVRVGP